MNAHTKVVVKLYSGMSSLILACLSDLVSPKCVSYPSQGMCMCVAYPCIRILIIDQIDYWNKCILFDLILKSFIQLNRIDVLII